MIWFTKDNQDAYAENRRFERVNPEDIFLVEFQTGDPKKSRLGEGKDISLGGVRFATSAMLKKGDRLKMTVYFPKHFPGPRKAEAGAFVHRVHYPGASHRLRVACEFLETSRMMEETLNSYLEWSKSQDLTPAG